MIAGLGRVRRGQSLVEFAVVALILYMLMAAILTFGHAIYVAQGLQTAADLGAREISRTPLPALIDDNGETRAFHFEDALQAEDVRASIYDPQFLVYDLEELGAQNFFLDVVPTWPVLNQQLATLMIVDRPDFDGDGQADANLIRYPGALLSDPSTPTGYTVGVPLIVDRDGDGAETVRWVGVVEEIESEANPDPFSIDSTARGLVALRINYPFQSASMSSFQSDPALPFESSVGTPNLATGAVTEVNQSERPGDLIGQPLDGDGMYAGTYGGSYGLGAQGALGQTVRPYRRVISAQAIYRREVFAAN